MIINALFLGGAKRVSLAERLIASGKESGTEVHIFSYELTHEVPISCVGTVIVGLRWNDNSLYDHLRQVIIENQINCVIPFIDPAIEVACKLKTRIPNLFVPVSSLDICRIMFDKKLSQTWFEEQEIIAPQAYKEEEVHNFPVILKPRTGSASKGIIVVQNAEEFAQLQNKNGLNTFLIQDYIADRTEFTVDCYVAQNGKIISAVPRIRKETTGGEATLTEVIHDASLEELSRTILKQGSFKGPITIQFIRDNKNGKTYVMEINPRYGGGVIATLEAGANTLKSLITELSGEEPSPCNQWESGVIMSRYFKEVFFYATNH